MSRQQFTVEDALGLATFAAPTWNDDGSRVGTQRFADGETAFVSWQVGPFEKSDFSLTAADPSARLDGDVSGHDWRPGHPETVAVVRDGDVVLFDAEDETVETLVAASEAASSPAWHPGGDVLAYMRDGALWLHDIETGTTRELAGNVADLFGPTPVEWSPGGRFVATVTERDDRLGITVYEPRLDRDANSEAEENESARTSDAAEEASIAWERTPEPAEQVIADAFEWAGSRLVYTEDAGDGTSRRYRVVEPGTDGPPYARGTVLLSEQDDRGLPSATLAGHEAGLLAVVAAPTGHHHLYVVDVDARAEAVGDDESPDFDGDGVDQLTEGPFEVRGDANDTPAWDESGGRLAYVTNEHDPGERRLHVAQVEDDTVHSFDDIDGNVVHPAWADDRVVCLRAGRTTPAAVHAFDVAAGVAQRVSAGHDDPESLGWFPEPEPVSFESSADGESVNGYLYAPADATEGDSRPAVIWAHGGPVRQMRRGFHHMRSYGFFHAFNHVLVDRGYVVLELNYRGGIGYGREYEAGIHHAIGETDVRDCVDAAAFLRAHPAVGDRVGFWGLSYGGFLANAVATTTDSVDCSVNFAGIWDWRDWVRYAADLNWGARRFEALFGGHPDDPDPELQERYRVASPCEHAEGLDTPLFGLHGTDDPNVPFAQMDDLVVDLVDRGAAFEMAYYPDEDHMFQQSSTWRDALGRVLPFLDEHLRS